MRNQQRKLREIDLEHYRTAFANLSLYYVPVKVRDLIVGTIVPCSIFLPSASGDSHEFDLEELISGGAMYGRSVHDFLTREDIEEVYISREKEDVFFNYFNQNLQKIIHSPDLPVEEKTELLYDNAESIVRKVFNERPTPSNIKLGLQFAENFADHITTDTVGVDALFSLFSKDYYTFTHSVQVAILGMAFCKAMGWEHEDVKSFGIGALFHDIGKNVIEESILNKPSRLDAEEFNIIKKHTVFGYQQLRDAQLITRDQLSIVLHHHEAADGSGYPGGLKGLEIHRFARVAHIVDVYDALTTKRPYKDAISPAGAMDIMGGDMRASFDPLILRAFFEFLGMEAKALPVPSGKRMSIELGNQVMIQLDRDETRLRATLVGLETEEYLILRIPGLAQVQKKIQPGREVVGRYAHCGTVYGFKANILGHIFHPLRLLFLSYPRVVENVNLRKSPRIDCFLPGEAVFKGKSYVGAVMDLSTGGCKFLVKQSDLSALPTVVPNEPIVLRIQLIGESKADIFAGKLRSIAMNAAEGKASFGIQFGELDEETRTHLHRCIENVLNLVH